MTECTAQLPSEAGQTPVAGDIHLYLAPYSVPVLHQENAPDMPYRGIVILLHGFPDTRYSWLATLECLSAQGYDCFAPTLPGYTESYLLSNDRYHFEALADELDRVVDAIADGRHVHLIGHDWGAVIAYWYAHRHGARLRSVGTLAIPPVHRLLQLMPKRPWLFSKALYQLRFQFPAYAERLLRRDGWAFMRELWTDWSPGWSGERHIEAAIEALQSIQVTRASLRYYQHAFRWFDPEWYRLFLVPIRYPMPWLMLHGNQDGLYGPEVFRHCVRPEDFPGGLERHLLEGVGHFLQLEQPALIHRHLLQFLARHAE